MEQQKPTTEILHSLNEEIDELEETSEELYNKLGFNIDGLKDILTYKAPALQEIMIECNLNSIEELRNDLGYEAEIDELHEKIDNFKSSVETVVGTVEQYVHDFENQDETELLKLTEELELSRIYSIDGEDVSTLQTWLKEAEQLIEKFNNFTGYTMVEKIKDLTKGEVFYTDCIWGIMGLDTECKFMLYITGNRNRYFVKMYQEITSESSFSPTKELYDMTVDVLGKTSPSYKNLDELLRAIRFNNGFKIQDSLTEEIDNYFKNK